MFNALTDAVNSTLSYGDALEEQQSNLLNAFTYGYQSTRTRLAPSSFGVVLEEREYDNSPGKLVFIKGEKVTKLALDPDYDNLFFLTRDGSKEYLTRLGDFKFTRKQRAPYTYIGQPYEERTYLTTQDGYLVMGYPIGRGPLEQAERFKDPLSSRDPVLLGESPIRTPKKKLSENEPLQLGPLVPIDLTRGANGLYLDKYEELETTNEGILRGLSRGIWVPLYKVGVVSVPNPAGLTHVGNTPYRLETEQSGLRQYPPSDIKIVSQNIEKSNISTKYASYEYKKLRNNLTLALNLQRSNNQLLQQFQNLINGGQ
ncbi:MAG: hypothetical protein SFT81_00925 [Candidatus Caenarcaniphilales bacterium]|nr:hypothetical protein [Candidatus Caenarcaniphilales bacterium]